MSKSGSPEVRVRGSIQKRTGKRGVSWCVVYDEPTSDGSRRQRRRTFRTRKEAEAFRTKALHEIQNGGYVEPTDQTLGDHLLGWLESYARVNVRPSTFQSYELNVRRHVLPALGDVPIQQVRPAHIQAPYDAKIKGGRLDGREGGPSPKTVRLIHLALHEALDHALKLGLIARNAAAATKPPRGRRPQVKTWDRDQMRAFLTASKDDGYAPAWLLAMATGMRRGELLGLRWADADLEQGRLHVRQSLVELRGKLHFQEPKTDGGRRVVPVPTEVVAALREHRKRQVERRLLLGAGWQVHDLVLASAVGGPIAPRNLSRRFKQLAKEAGLPDIPCHGLRHAHATQLLRDGILAKVVSERLGHASISLTLDTYSHVLPDMQAPAVSAIGAALFGPDHEEGVG
jgi:integrase